MRRRHNNEILETGDPLDSSDQEYFIELFKEDEISRVKTYKRILIVFFLLQTPFAVYWRPLRKAHPVSCFSSLLSIIITVCTIHYDIEDMRRSLTSKSAMLAQVLHPTTLAVINSMLCLRLLVTVFGRGNSIWRVYFLLPFADFLLSLILFHWHQNIVRTIQDLNGLKYKHKVLWCGVHT